MSQIATLIYALGILGLFMLDRDRRTRTSKALWLPVVWLLINGSRPVSLWLQIAPAASQPVFYLEGSPFDRNIYLALIIAGVIVLYGRQITIRFLRANPSILLYVLYCAVSICWSDYPDVAFKRWIKSIGDIVMVLIVLTDPERSCAVKRLLGRAGFLLIPISILLIKYYPEMARYYSRWEGRMFVSGVAEDKNMLGMTCLICGLAAWWRLLGAWREQRGRERRRRVAAHGTIFAMVLWLFWQANSMTSLSCFVMAGGLIAMTSVFRVARKPAVLHVLVATVLCASVAVLFLGAGGGALATMGRNSTLTGRTEIWRELLRVTGNPLFGTGFESFWLGERLREIWSMGGLLDGINEAHNAYLHTFLNLGWIGVVLLALLLVTGYRNVVAALRRDPETGRLGLAFFVTAVVYAFTESAAFQVMSPVWFGFLLATTAAPEALARKPAQAARGASAHNNA